MTTETKCLICNGLSRELFSYELGIGDVATLLSCSTCGFAFVDSPNWLESSFTEKLHRVDVGSVDRSNIVAQFLLGTLMTSRKRRRWQLLDIGGGDGLLTRLLRDRGVDARFIDPYTTPVFNVGPEVLRSQQFDLGVMSEVALHFDDPVKSFTDALQTCESVLFTAVSPPAELTCDWWYLMPSTGQHIAFYPASAVEALAVELDVDWCSDGRFFHLLSKSKIPRSLRLLVRYRELALLAGWWWQLVDLTRRSLGRSRALTAGDQQNVESQLSRERRVP